MALKRRDVIPCASLERRYTGAVMAQNTSERTALHRDRKRRGARIVPIEIREDWFEIIDCCTDLSLDDYPDGDFSAIPMDVLKPAAQVFVDTAVKLATAIDD